MKAHERNSVVDGLKGMAILIVILHHFALAFYPAIIAGFPHLSHTKDGIELFIFKTPLSLPFAGSFAVALFFLITGYVLTKQTIKNIENKTYISNAIYLRIFRLIPLIAVVLFIGYICMSQNLTFNIPVNLYTKSGWLASFYPPGKVSIFQIAIDVISKIPFVASAKYYNVLWIIPSILFGSWLVYAAAYIFHNDSKKFPMYCVLLLAFYNTPYISFLFGMIIAENEEKIHIPTFFLYLGLIFSLLFGSSTIKALDIKMLAPLAGTVKQISAALFFLAFTQIKWLSFIAETRLFIYFGRNSYYYYLTHMLALIMVPSYVFLLLIPSARYSQAVLATFGLYVVMTILYSEVLKNGEGVILKRK